MSIIINYTEAELRAPSLREVLRYARASSDEASTALARTALDELSGKLCPRICYERVNIRITDSLVDLGFCAVNSESLSKALCGCNSAIVFAATVGIEPDRLIAKYSRLSPTKALFIQAAGSERIEALCDLFCAKIEQELSFDGKTARPRFSAGYGDLPLSMQKDIFALLTPQKIGISISESLLMTPTKSVTAIIGIKDNR